MKTDFIILAAAAALLASCDLLGPLDERDSGFLYVSFDRNAFQATKAGACEAVPDSNSFLLTIISEDGSLIYDGRFGDSPQTLELPEGNYSVSARSREFDEPLFDAPQYADEQLVTVSSGKTACVSLVCSQTNCGVRLIVDPTFRTDYPEGILYLKSADGRLMYGYAEKRVAYFKPGAVSLAIAENGSERTLLTRSLQAREILSLRICSSGRVTETSGIHITVDTSRVYLEEVYEDGSLPAGGDLPEALSVPEAMANQGAEDVWVYGYIVGDSSSTSKSEFSAPFSSNTNLLLATRSSVSDRNGCISVELPKGDVRNALNLKDHPDNLGRQVFLKGDIVDKYYGLVGLKSVKDFEWK